MAKDVYIVIGCDTDPDRPGFLDNVPDNGLTWRGMLDGIPRAKEALKEIHDSNDVQPIFTWCLRVDYQVRKIHGAYDYILTEHKDFLSDLEHVGDELAWHPHFWKDDPETGQWYQECFNTQWQVEMLKEAYTSYMKIFPDRAKSVRMGWDYHNNDTFKTLQDLGVQVDFSGIPGLKIIPQNENVRSVNFFDWSKSPNRPYIPALEDYRREANGSETSFKLIESPNFVSESFIWGMISGLVLAKKMKSPGPIFNALKRPTYWINITGKSNLFEPLIKQVKTSLKKHNKIVFVTYFHPDELLPNKSNLYSLEFMKANIERLVSEIKNVGGAAHFIKASDIINNYFK